VHHRELRGGDGGDPAGRQQVLPVRDVDDAVGVRGCLLEPVEVLGSPRRTFAPSADSAAAAVSDRARPVTSCPAATSSGTMYEPEWPVPPVTKTRKLLLLVSGSCWVMLAARGALSR
jgi:hypothetical protein